MKKIKNYFTFLKEAQETPDPEIITSPQSRDFEQVEFGQGKSTIDKAYRDNLLERLSDKIGYYQNWNDIIEFLSKNRGAEIPPLFTISVGTSWEGGDEVNKTLAQNRRTFMENLLIEAIQKTQKTSGYIVPAKELIQKLIMDKTTYERSNTQEIYGGNFDPKEQDLDFWNRKGFIGINGAEIKGLTVDRLSKLAANMRSGESRIPDDLNKILVSLCQCQTYSDLQRINKNLEDHGGLEKFLNSTVGYNKLNRQLRPLNINDRSRERNKAIACINRASRASKKGDIAREFNDKIVISVQEFQ